MSSSMQGMDTDWARQMSSQMGKHAGIVSVVCQQLFSRLDATAWTGTDKSRCSDDLVNHFLPAANGTAEAINEQARNLSVAADRQDQCSA